MKMSGCSLFLPIYQRRLQENTFFLFRYRHPGNFKLSSKFSPPGLTGMERLLLSLGHRLINNQLFQGLPVFVEHDGSERMFIALAGVFPGLFLELPVIQVIQLGKSLQQLDVNNRNASFIPKDRGKKYPKTDWRQLKEAPRLSHASPRHGVPPGRNSSATGRPG